MEKIGMVVAVEMKAVQEKYGDALRTYRLGGFDAGDYKIAGKPVIILHSGAGEIAAAAATQALIDSGCGLILNFGVVGGLTDEISKTRLCVVEKVVHYDFDTTEVDDVETGRYLELPDIYIPADRELLEKAVQAEPSLAVVTCASADKFIGDPEKKRNLAKRFRCEICEMEGAGIALTCYRNKVPCLMIKMVSDSVEGGANEFVETLFSASLTALNAIETVLGSIA